MCVAAVKGREAGGRGCAHTQHTHAPSNLPPIIRTQAQGPRVYFSWIRARVRYRGFELPLPRFVQVGQEHVLCVWVVELLDVCVWVRSSCLPCFRRSLIAEQTGNAHPSFPSRQHTQTHTRVSATQQNAWYENIYLDDDIRVVMVRDWMCLFVVVGDCWCVCVYVCVPLSVKEMWDAHRAYLRPRLSLHHDTKP